MEYKVSTRKTYRTSYPIFPKFNVPSRRPVMMNTCISKDHRLAGSPTLPHDHGNRNPLRLVEKIIMTQDRQALLNIAKPLHSLKVGVKLRW